MNLSNTALTPAGVRSDITLPASIIKSQAISTLSSVGFSSNNVSNYKPTYSEITYWFIKWANIFVVDIHTILLFPFKLLILNNILTFKSFLEL